MEEILVIGGSSGVGKQLVNDLLQQGNKVIATFYKHEITLRHENLTSFYYDVKNDSQELEQISSLKALIYCPGSIDLKPFNRFNEDELMEDLRLNVLGAHRVIKNVIGHLKKASNPSITLFSTVAATIGFPYHSKIGISKGAVEGFAKSLAAELAPTVRVNVIAPSLFDSPLSSSLLSNEKKVEMNAKRHPLGRVGDCKDISNLVQFIISDKASWITGQVIKVDGGLSSIKL